MSIPKQTKAIINQNPPIGDIKDDTFKIVTQDIPDLQDGQLLIKNIALGNEPAMKGWMDGDKDERRMYAPLIHKGEIIRCPVIGEVVASRSNKYKEGQRVTGMAGWAEYSVVQADQFQPAVEIKGHSEWLSLGGLGLTGKTAWVGAFEECKLKPEHTVLVSGAAGAVGTAFLQIAKNVVGCKKVIGIAGGKEKCDFVKKLGADDCIDYKDENFAQNLKKALPDYADIYFDNVGGDVLNEAFTVVKRYGFISVCGAIAGYHGQQTILNNWFEVIANRLTARGFILFDHIKSLPKAQEELTKWVEDGKLSLTEGETVVETKFEDIPQTWQKLFTGGNKGKLITKLV